MEALVIEAMRTLGITIREGILAWLGWRWREPCDAWVFHAAMYALTPRRRKATRRWHAALGRRSLARCVMKCIREGRVPPRIESNPARWLEVRKHKEAQRVIKLCEQSIRRSIPMYAAGDDVARRAIGDATRLVASMAPRPVPSDDTPVEGEV